MARWNWEEEDAPGLPLSPSVTFHETYLIKVLPRGGGEGGHTTRETVFLSAWAFWRTVMILIIRHCMKQMVSPKRYV